MTRLALAIALLVAAPARATDPPHDASTAFGTRSCFTCHTPHGGVWLFDPGLTGSAGDRVENLCRSCHFAGGPAPEKANHVVSLTPPITCVACHDPHEQAQPVGKFLRERITAPSGAVRPIVLIGAGLLDLCLACHEESIGTVPAINWNASRHGAAPAEPLMAGTVVTGFPLVPSYDASLRGTYSIDCVACHQPHAGSVNWLIRGVINGSPVVPRSDEARTTLGLCDLCHQHTPRHHNDDVYTKSSTSNCSYCHPLHADPYLSCSTGGCHGHAGRF